MSEFKPGHVANEAWPIGARVWWDMPIPHNLSAPQGLIVEAFYEDKDGYLCRYINHGNQVDRWIEKPLCVLLDGLAATHEEAQDDVREAWGNMRRTISYRFGVAHSCDEDERGMVTAWLAADARLAMVERAMAAVEGERDAS